MKHNDTKKNEKNNFEFIVFNLKKTIWINNLYSIYTKKICKITKIVFYKITTKNYKK